MHAVFRLGRLLALMAPLGLGACVSHAPYALEDIFITELDIDGVREMCGVRAAIACANTTHEEFCWIFIPHRDQIPYDWDELLAHEIEHCYGMTHPRFGIRERRAEFYTGGNLDDFIEGSAMP